MIPRIAVTGMGLVSPLGLDVRTYWHGLLEGRSGVSFITDFPTERLRSDVAAQVKGFDPSQWLDDKEQVIYGRVEQFAVAAAAEAIDQAKLGAVDKTRVGVLLSTGQGAVEIFEEQIKRSNERGAARRLPYFIPGVMLNAVSALVTVKHHFMGPSFNIASACATASHSIAVSAMMLLTGEADVMIAGGGEAATRLNTVAGFGNARALARAFQGDPPEPRNLRRRPQRLRDGRGGRRARARDRSARPSARCDAPRLSRRVGG